MGFVQPHVRLEGSSARGAAPLVDGPLEVDSRRHIGDAILSRVCRAQRQPFDNPGNSGRNM